jgi:hypothetical protein
MNAEVFITDYLTQFTRLHLSYSFQCSKMTEMHFSMWSFQYWSLQYLLFYPVLTILKHTFYWRNYQQFQSQWFPKEEDSRS